MTDRLVPLAGGHNFRDFGGYATVDGGHVRRGVLFRSGAMTHVTANDVAALRALGIVTLCDLRTRAERTRQPTTWLAGAANILADDDAPSAATLAALLRDRAATAADVRRAMIALYRDLPFDHIAMMRLLLRHLTDGRVPLLVNCTAGKDRTGIAAAIVLRALGVRPALIEEDFMVSNVALDPTRLLADSGLDRAHDVEIARAMLLVEPAYLAAAFAAIDERFGSFRTYLATVLDVDAADESRLRALLVDHSEAQPPSPPRLPYARPPRHTGPDAATG